MKKLNDNLICVFSGLLSAACMLSERLYFIAFFSMAPVLILMIRDSDLKKSSVFRRMFIYYMVYMSVSLSWLTEINTKMYNGSIMTLLVIVILILLLSVVHAAVTGICTCVYSSVRNKKVTDVFLFAFLFILSEWFHETFYPVTFPWFRLAAAVVPYTNFIQSADIFGSLFISFLIVSVNGLIAYFYINIKNIKNLIKCTELAVVIFSANTLYGSVSADRMIFNEDEIGVILIQSNIGEQNKHRCTERENLDCYISALESISYDGEELVVLPESAITFNIIADKDKINELVKIAAQNNVNIVFGLFYDENNEKYNSMVAIHPDGEISEIYSKKLLVPFGEMVPLEWLTGNIVRKAFNRIGRFSCGKNTFTIETGSGCGGCIICYESLYPAEARKAVEDDAEFLMVLSNDSWFGGSAEIFQHHAHSVLRAVENNRFLLRCSATGITSVISPDGKIIERAPEDVQYILRGKISPVSRRSIYSMFGDIIVLPAAFIFISGILRKNDKGKNGQ